MGMPKLIDRGGSINSRFGSEIGQNQPQHIGMPWAKIDKKSGGIDLNRWACPNSSIRAVRSTADWAQKSGRIDLNTWACPQVESTSTHGHAPRWNRPQHMGLP
ncbi:hypothetical protein AMTR_s00020p00248270 [Amborella trichopoda]|uniref:Uncharacterized protein n=1 Tax=Amborella trichopoda TaxID=13333 RepID=W1PV30_AMBTC|nr:hypothetical protein AMTR_s00020p00248270 [Amborella trichopoda]